jgi:hypothetical protein
VKYPKEKNLEYKISIKETDHLKKLETPSDFFTFYSEDTTLIGKKGTKITISRSCLAFENGDEVTGPVKIELKEIFSKSELIFNNKPTVSDRQMLVSAGAIFLNALSEGRNLKVSCPKGILFSLPKQSDYPGMQVFNGLINAKGDINWIPEEKKEETILNEEEYKIEEEDYFSENNFEGGFIFSDSWETNNFEFSATKFGWINCDAFYEDTRPKTNLIVKISDPLPEDFNPDFSIEKFCQMKILFLSIK